MASVIPILLLGLAGALVGGAYSLHRQGAGRISIAVMVGLGVVAAVAGVLWLVPE